VHRAVFLVVEVKRGKFRKYRKMEYGKRQKKVSK
jgi:hypothetical protein